MRCVQGPTCYPLHMNKSYGKNGVQISPVWRFPISYDIEIVSPKLHGQLQAMYNYTTKK